MLVGDGARSAFSRKGIRCLLRLPRSQNALLVPVEGNDDEIGDDHRSRAAQMAGSFWDANPVGINRPHALDGRIPDTLQPNSLSRRRWPP
jgi:hypothetical protein